LALGSQNDSERTDCSPRSPPPYLRPSLEQRVLGLESLPENAIAPSWECQERLHAEAADNPTDL